jgi:ABC-type Na+ efflux pump permease subunit
MQINAIFRKEFLNFFGSERGSFAIYLILIFVWSFLPLTQKPATGDIWWLFFSVIISGNFSNNVFVAERLNGSMEILLTSGFSRDAVFFGKIAFVTVMSGIMGLICCIVAFFWILISGVTAIDSGSVFYVACIYIAGTAMNTSCGAWLSVRLRSPRIIPVITIMVMAAVVSLFYLLLYIIYLPGWSLLVILFSAAILFSALARHEFNGERIIQPVNL